MTAKASVKVLNYYDINIDIFMDAIGVHVSALWAWHWFWLNSSSVCLGEENG